MSAVTTVVNIINFIAKVKKRETLFSFFKYSICFFLPIFFITHELFVMKYGSYRFITNNTFQFCADNPGRIVYGFVVFGLTFALAYALEKYLLPLIGMFSGKYDLSEPKEVRQYINKGFSQGFGANFTKQQLREIRKDVEAEKFDFFGFLSFIPVCILLWTTFLSFSYGWYFALLVIPVVLIHWWVLKIANSAIGILGRY